MAEIRQDYIGNFSQNNIGVGIGTSSPTDAKLEVLGGTTVQELDVTGISTFTHVSGFVKKHTDYTGSIDFDSGDSGTLSGEIVVGAGLTMTVGTAATTSQGSVDSLKVSNMFQPPSGTTNQRPPGKPGALFYNFDLKRIEFFDGSSWRQVENKTTRGRGIAAGGNTGSKINNISYITLTTLGNALDFGDLTLARGTAGSGSNATRGVFAGGEPNTNIIDFITIASTGDAQDFGDLQTASYSRAGVSSPTRVCFGGGASPSVINTIDFIAIPTTGNASDFGDLTRSNRGMTSCSNGHGGLS